jgi:hypothetical protein
MDTIKSEFNRIFGEGATEEPSEDDQKFLQDEDMTEEE